jgi:exodeoxyribonuclease VIII
MVDGCLQNKMARNLLTNEDLLAEYSFIAECPETGLELKCRPDGLLKEAGIVIDLKSCLDASYRGFDKAVRNYRYDLQECFYRYVLKLCGYPTTNFIFIATEKNSYATACYEMSDKYNKYAEAEMFKTLKKIKVAQDTNTFDTGWPELDTISLPAYLDEDHGL